jgi:hypothetical protein
MAVAVYFLDRLALRAGHEKDEDEADTVGCCTLKVSGWVGMVCEGSDCVWCRCGRAASLGRRKVGGSTAGGAKGVLGICLRASGSSGGRGAGLTHCTPHQL